MGKVCIRQIFYDKKQNPFLEEGAMPFFNDGRVPAAEREFGVMKACYDSAELFCDSVEYEGFISWKFAEKARIPLKSFVSAVEENPGYDVYILNPFPHQVLYENIWLQGESHHPGLLKMSQDLIEKAGLNWDLEKSASVVSNYSYCNFWVGNKVFWDIFMRYGHKLYDKLISDQELKRQFFKPAPGGNVEAPYFAFFFERLITEVLNHHPEIRVKSFRYPLGWLNQNYRSDVAQFLSALPWDQDLKGWEGYRTSVSYYLKQMETAADFYGGDYFGNPVLKYLKRQKGLRDLIKNPMTVYLYRRLLKKTSDNSETIKSCKLL